MNALYYITIYYNLCFIIDISGHSSFIFVMTKRLRTGNTATSLKIAPTRQQTPALANKLAILEVKQIESAPVNVANNFKDNCEHLPLR